MYSPNNNRHFQGGGHGLDEAAFAKSAYDNLRKTVRQPGLSQDQLKFLVGVIIGAMVIAELRKSLNGIMKHLEKTFNESVR